MTIEQVQRVFQVPPQMVQERESPSKILVGIDARGLQLLFMPNMAKIPKIIKTAIVQDVNVEGHLEGGCFGTAVVYVLKEQTDDLVFYDEPNNRLLHPNGEVMPCSITWVEDTAKLDPIEYIQVAFEFVGRCVPFLHGLFDKK